MSFEKYIPPKKVKSTVQEPAIKMLKGGQISLNKAAYKAYLKGATFVELFYDAQSKKIGLSPKKYGTKAGHKIKAVGKGKATYRINAQRFAEFYGIKPKGKAKLSPSWNAKEGLLELS